jgi:hypothetical protein
MDPKSGVHFWVRCAHRADKWTRFSALSDALIAKGEHRMDPKSGFHFWVRCSTALQEILLTPEVRAWLLDLGIEAKSEAPAEHAERLRSDIEKWRAVIEKAGIPKQ